MIFFSNYFHIWRLIFIISVKKSFNLEPFVKGYSRNSLVRYSPYPLEGKRALRKYQFFRLTVNGTEGGEALPNLENSIPGEADW